VKNLPQGTVYPQPHSLAADTSTAPDWAAAGRSRKGGRSQTGQGVRDLSKKDQSRLAHGIRWVMRRILRIWDEMRQSLPCDKVSMWTYLIIVAGFFLLVLARRGRNQERAASGMLTSPLYLTASGLSVLLVGVTMYMASLRHDVSWGWWIVVGAMVIAILAMRRALKWRYPYR
jgi:hypothetical protein